MRSGDQMCVVACSAGGGGVTTCQCAGGRAKADGGWWRSSLLAEKGWLAASVGGREKAAMLGSRKHYRGLCETPRNL